MTSLCANICTVQLTLSQSDALSSIKGQFVFQNTVCVALVSITARYYKNSSCFFPYLISLFCSRADSFISNPVQAA